MFKKSWPLALTAFAASLYMKIDQIMIANILGNDLVGQYAAAVRLTEAIYFIPIVITASLFPAIINARENNVEVYIKRLQGLYSLIVYIAILIAVPVSLFSGQIINLLYGPEFSGASEVWTIHIWASIFVFLNAAFAKFLYAESYEIKYLYRSLFGAVVNIIGNFILIPIFSIQGAAFATLISLIAMNYVFDIIDSELRPYLLMKFRCFNPKNILLTLRDF
jgi:O-antigen/teichoic acid export membrane protein